MTKPIDPDALLRTLRPSHQIRRHLRRASHRCDIPSVGKHDILQDFVYLQRSGGPIEAVRRRGIEPSSQRHKIQAVGETGTARCLGNGWHLNRLPVPTISRPPDSGAGARVVADEDVVSEGQAATRLLSNRRVRSCPYYAIRRGVIISPESRDDETPTAKSNAVESVADIG